MLAPTVVAATTKVLATTAAVTSAATVMATSAKSATTMASASAMTATTVTSAAARINVGAPSCNAEKNGGGKCKKALYLHGSYSVRECDHRRGGFKRRHLRSQRRQDVSFLSNNGWWAWLRIAANQIGLGVDDMAFNTANFDAHLAGVLQPIGEGAFSNMPTAAGAGWANLV